MFCQNSKSKFRSTFIYNTSAGFAEYYELYTKNAIQYNTNTISTHVNDYTHWNNMLFSTLKYGTFKFINIQSTISEDGQEADNQLKIFLEDDFNKMVS